MEAFRNKVDPKPGKSAVLRSALEKHLKERGFWPPPED
jgi:hypothetical protein